MPPPSGYVETLIKRLLEDSSFGHLLEGSPEERLNYLANACAQDELLRARLHELLTSLAGPTAAFPAPPPLAATVVNMLESALTKNAKVRAKGCKKTSARKN